MSSLDDAEQAREQLVSELEHHPAFSGVGIVALKRKGYGLKIYIDTEGSGGAELTETLASGYHGVPVLTEPKPVFTFEA